MYLFVLVSVSRLGSCYASNDTHVCDTLYVFMQIINQVL